jgi:hypothetical protein
MYDVKTGKRFDKTHPIWSTYMTNKDGSIKERMDNKKAAELASLGLITLVPSTTEVAKIADSSGAFGAGANWGCEIGVDAALASVTLSRIDELEKEMEGLLCSWRVAAISRARDAMNKPRDIGSDLHDAFHCMRNGLIKDPTDQHKRMYDACTDALSWLGIPISEVGTEVEFALDTHGGTVDLEFGGKVLLDWKTVQKDRPSKVSEFFQLGGYRKKFPCEVAYLVYIRQSDFKAVIKTLSAKQLDIAEEGFERCLATWTAIKNMEGVMRT